MPNTKIIKYKGESIYLTAGIHWWNGRPFNSLAEIKRMIDIIS